tara:strand:+ start:78 stop:503 length:426 start_codon:yes stop_codon:yes gene_type:complete
MAALGVIWGILLLLVGLIQIYAGFIGLEYHFGSVAAFGALFLAFFLRIMFPLTIGTFLCAMNVWGWPWYGAALFAAPGLLFILPALVTAAIGSLFEKKRQSDFSQSYNNEYEESVPKDVTPKKKVKKIIKKRIIKRRKKAK